MKALITAPFHESGIKILKKYMDIIYENWRETGILYRDSDEYIDKIKKENADVLITEGDSIDKEVLNLLNTNVTYLRDDHENEFGVELEVDNEDINLEEIEDLD